MSFKKRGFVVASDANNSYFLTAAHVLGCADTDKVGCRDTVKVRFVGQLASTTGTKVLAWKNSADGTDLALVKVARGNLQPVPILSQTAIDDEFYVIGFNARIISTSRYAFRPKAAALAAVPSADARPQTGAAASPPQQPPSLDVTKRAN